MNVGHKIKQAYFSFVRPDEIFHWSVFAISSPCAVCDACRVLYRYWPFRHCVCVTYRLSLHSRTLGPSDLNTRASCTWRLNVAHNRGTLTLSAKNGSTESQCRRGDTALAMTTCLSFLSYGLVLYMRVNARCDEAT